MTKNKKHIGIDISKLTFDVAIKNENEKYLHYKFSNDYEGFEKLNKLIDNESDVCVMEASGPYYLKLATYLSENKISVCVINPLVIRRFSQMRMSRTKTDKKDATIIAEYGKTESPDLWKPEADYLLELRQMQAYVEQMNKSRTGFIRQREAFKYNTVIAGDMNESLEKMLAALENEIALIEIKMLEIVNQYHSQLFEQLNSIPGIGKKRQCN